MFDLRQQTMRISIYLSMCMCVLPDPQHVSNSIKICQSWLLQLQQPDCFAALLDRSPTFRASYYAFDRISGCGAHGKCVAPLCSCVLNFLFFFLTFKRIMLTLNIFNSAASLKT